MLSQNSASEHNVIFTQLLNAFCLIAGHYCTLLIPRFMDLRSSSLGSVSLLCWFQVCFFQKFQNSMQLRSKENISQAIFFKGYQSATNPSGLFLRYINVFEIERLGLLVLTVRLLNFLVTMLFQRAK